MAFTGKYEYDTEGIDRIIDERGNSALILRNVRWNEDKDFKLDLRNYYFTDEGERYGKGISFLTEDGPDELVRILLEEGYGKPDEIAEAICNRDDIIKAFGKLDVISVDEEMIKEIQKETVKEITEKMYDPREMIS